MDTRCPPSGVGLFKDKVPLIEIPNVDVLSEGGKTWLNRLWEVGQN